MTDTSAIIDELITLEPDLAPHRKTLERNIDAIIRAKPDTKFTAAFKQKLLKELRSEFFPSPSSVPLIPMFHKLSFAFGGALVGALAIFVFLKNPAVPSPSVYEDRMPTAMEEGEAVQKVGPQAFGSLALSDDGSPISARGLGGGAPVMESSIAAIEPAAIATNAAYGDMDMRIAPMRTIEYMYEGEIPLSAGSVDVFRKLRPSSLPGNPGLSIGGIPLDWSRLGNMRVRSMQIGDSGTDPLTAYIDYAEGVVSINREIDYSKRPESKCQDQACFDRYRVQLSDIPGDDTVISIADAVLSDLGVDTSAYGEPQVDHSWRHWYEREPNKESYYFPESLMVLYPLSIEGKPVFDQFGNRTGLAVHVDFRAKQATSIGPLTALRFESSTYDAVTDQETARAFILKGGMMSFLGYDEPEKEQATLGDPQEGYMQYYHWDPDTMKGEELYIPALVFPVTGQPDGTFDYRPNVVLPLAQDLLDDVPQIMPLIREVQE